MRQPGVESAQAPAEAELYRRPVRSLRPAVRELDGDRDRFERPVLVFTFEHLCWAVVGAYAIASRLTGLGDRPLAPNEAGIALFDYRLSRDGLNALDGGGFTLPALMHVMQATLMKIAGANDPTARIGFALWALGLVAIAYTMRRHVGRVGALALAGLIAISPTISWVSRSASMATVALVAALITIRLFLAFCRKPRFAIAAALGAGAALTMSADALGLATVAVMTAAGLLLIAWEAIANPDFREDIAFFKGTTAERLGVAAIVCAALYTSLTPHHLSLPGAGAVGLGTVGAGTAYLETLAYYGPIAASYEILIVALGGAGGFLCATNRIRSPFARWCVIWSALSAGFFLAIGARSIEFAVLMLLPLSFVAGFAADYLYHTRSWRWLRIPLAIAGAMTVYFQIGSNFIYATPVIAGRPRPAHAPLLWMGGATTEETRTVSEKIAAGFRERRMAPRPTAYVTPAAPMLDSIRWYLRDFAVIADPAAADVVVLADSSPDGSGLEAADLGARNLERITVAVENRAGAGVDDASITELASDIFALRPLLPIETDQATIAWYSFDKPAVAGPAPDSRRLLKVLGRARDLGNTAVVVESGMASAAPAASAIEQAAAQAPPEMTSRTLPATTIVSEANTMVAAPTKSAQGTSIAGPIGAMVFSSPPSPYGIDPISKLPFSTKDGGGREITNFEQRSIKVAALERASPPKSPPLPMAPIATSRSDSRVLIVGGKDEKGGFITASAEYFDTASNRFIPIKGGMYDPRESYSATRLGDGRVLIAGGKSTVDGDIVGTAEIFDPTVGTFTLTRGIMTAARQAHTATALANGQVLIAGGLNALDGVLNSGELFNPATEAFSHTGNMTDGRRSHTATALPDARVLIAGGVDESDRIAASAEIFDPANAKFTGIADMNDSRCSHTATVLKDGRVLIAGGINDAGEVIATAEIFDPARGVFSRTAGAMNVARYAHAATLLPDGMVLISGGFTNRSSAVTSAAEVFDPATGTFALVGTMNEPRESHAATLLDSGKVLITGGGLDFNGQVADSAELFDPVKRKFTLVGTRMVESREVHTATPVQ